MEEQTMPFFELGHDLEKAAFAIPNTYWRPFNTQQTFTIDWNAKSNEEIYSNDIYYLFEFIKNLKNARLDCPMIQTSTQLFLDQTIHRETFIMNHLLWYKKIT